MHRVGYSTQQAIRHYQLIQPNCLSALTGALHICVNIERGHSPGNTSKTYVLYSIMLGRTELMVVLKFLVGFPGTRGEAGPGIWCNYLCNLAF